MPTPTPVTPIWPAMVNAAPPKVPKAPKVPSTVFLACVEKGPSGYLTQTWCGRLVDQSYEYLMKDAGHAERHYADGNRPGLRACPDCIREIRAEKKKEGNT
jgi:hypothetical protein